MRTQLKTLAVAATLVAGFAAAPAVYAHQSQGSQGSMMGGGNMMGMMGQMNEMIGTCNKIMQGMMKNHDSEKPKVQSPNPDSTK